MFSSCGNLVPAAADALARFGNIVIPRLALEHALQVDQMVVEDLARDLEQLEDLRVAHRVVHARAHAPGIDDVPTAQDSELLRDRGRVDRQFGLRAYRLENPAQVGKSIASFRKANPEYRIVNVSRGGEQLGADPGLVLRKGDIIALGGATEHLTDKMGLIGPEVADPKTLGIPMDQAEILVTNKEVVGRTFESFRGEAMAGQLQVTKVERGGVTIPAGLKTELQRMDIVSNHVHSAIR